MDFFEEQRRAQKKSTKLILLFCLATLCVALLTLLALVMIHPYFFLKGLSHDMSAAYENSAYLELVFAAIRKNPQQFLQGGITIILILSAVSLTKYWSIKSMGGQGVIEKLGGQKLVYEAATLPEKKLLNIVEEMAIASSTPMPQVYVLPHSGSINAMVAGFRSDDMALAVTEGAIQNLNREELQGVIAHEYSHVFYGDMNLNMKMIGALHGLFFIQAAGELILHGSSGRRSRNTGNAIVFAGLALYVIGMLGYFFGSWIRASLSRQREFLADAAAVQYTRNPGGITSALQKIAQQGASKEVSNTLETSHMFFAATTNFFHRQFATHPPIQTRIRRITGYTSTNEKSPLSKKAVQAAQTPNTAASIPAGALGFAHFLRQKIPHNLYENTHDLLNARAIVYALFIVDDENAGQKQYDILAKSEPATIIRLTQETKRSLLQLDKPTIAAIFQILNPILKQMSPQQVDFLMNQVENLILADHQLQVFEFSLYRILDNSLAAYHPKSRKRPLLSRAEAFSVALSFLAKGGPQKKTAPEKCYAQAAASLRLKAPYNGEINLQDLNAALIKLYQERTKTKKAFMQAVQICIEADGVLEEAEKQMARIYGEAIGVVQPLGT